MIGLDAALLVRVDDAWHERTLGDLNLVEGGGDGYGVDADLADVVLRLAAYARQNVAATPAVQHDGRGEEIPGGVVDEDELARRIVGALDLVLFGGAA